jgi:hypothetical protein
MTAYYAASVDLSHLNPYQVSYDPKQIHAEAVLVTTENIGKLSLEFETELLRGGDGISHFYIKVARKLEQDTTETGMTGNTLLCVRQGDWIVPLRNEIHVYPDDIFRKTFDVIGPPLPILSHETVSELGV